MTNAAKYGALSASGGRLAISWSLDESGDCEIQWSEAGSAVLSTPDHEGFGTKLIRSTVAYDLGGSADIEHAPDGLRARLRIPAIHVSAADSPPGVPREAEHAASTLLGLSVLIVEDQALIALDTEETLRKLGAGEIRLAPNVRDAKRALLAAVPDVAVLDGLRRQRHDTRAFPARARGEEASERGKPLSPDRDGPGAARLTQASTQCERRLAQVLRDSKGGRVDAANLPVRRQGTAIRSRHGSDQSAEPARTVALLPTSLPPCAGIRQQCMFQAPSWPPGERWSPRTRPRDPPSLMITSRETWASNRRAADRLLYSWRQHPNFDWSPTVEEAVWYTPTAFNS